MNNQDKKEELKIRDECRCGIHFGGCGKKFLPEDEITIDHMIPKSFLRTKKSKHVFSKMYFLQPMHKTCNSEIKGGQINGYPLFNCDCHYLYFNVKKNIAEVFYKNKMGQWKFDSFYDSKILCETGSFTLIPGQRDGKVGYGRHQFGHILPTFSKANQCYMRNLHSLMKCVRLEQAEKEIDLFDLEISNQEKIEIYFNIGIIYGKYKNHTKATLTKAMEYFGEAIKLDPKDANAYYNRGVAKTALGNYEEAIKDYNKAIELNSKDASAYNNRGNAKNALGRHKEAIKDYNEAIVLDPQLSEAYYNRGNANAALDNYEEAIKDYNKAIDLNPKHAKAYYNRGSANSNLGEYTKAIADYTEAKKIFEKKGNVPIVEKCEQKIERLKELMAE